MTHTRTTLLRRVLVPALTCGLVAAGSTPVWADPLEPEPTTAGLYAGEQEHADDAFAGDLSGEVVPGPTAPTTTAPTGVDGLAFAATVSAPAPPATPAHVVGLPLDVEPGYYMYSDSCDPVVRPGLIAFAELVGMHYGKTRYSTSRTCRAGDRSNHYEGRAVDWPMNALDPVDKAIGDSAAAWLTANGGAVARRLGVTTIIWNRAIWYSYRPSEWRAYSGPSPHTDHLHFSFTWDGAFKRTSWWTGVPVTKADHGTCRVYALQYAPLYVGPRASRCDSDSTLPVPPPSPYGVHLPGATHGDVAIAQSQLGVPADGSFGPQTRAALLEYQRRSGIPVTGVLDNATWHRMFLIPTVAPYAQMVASPDVSGDGYADAVVVDAQGRLAVHPGLGAGRLGPPRAFELGWDELTVHAPGDWDGDKRGDLMATDPEGRLFLHRGDGTGGFLAPIQVGFGWTGLRIVPAGDVTTDGVADLLAIAEDGSLYLYRGLPGGLFAKRVQVGNGWTGYELHAAGDMTGDGIADILGIDEAGKLWFYAGRGPGTFHTRSQVGFGWSAYGFASGGDFNRDGTADLLGRDPYGTVYFYAGQRAGTFAKKVEVARGW